MDTHNDQDSDLRRFVRRLTKDNYQVVDTEDWTVFGTVLDLSVRGLRIARKTALKVGSVHDLTVDPTLHLSDITPIRIGGKVRWCDQESADSWICGLEIKAIGRADSVEMETLFSRIGQESWTED